MTNRPDNNNDIRNASSGNYGPYDGNSSNYGPSDSKGNSSNYEPYGSNNNNYGPYGGDGNSSNYGPSGNYGNYGSYPTGPSPYQAGPYPPNPVAIKRAFNPFDLLSAFGGLLVILIPILDFMGFSDGLGLGYNYNLSLLDILTLSATYGFESEDTELIRIIAYVVMIVGGVIVLLSLLRLRKLNLVVSMISGLLLILFFLYMTLSDKFDYTFDYRIGFYLTLIAGLVLMISPILALTTARNRHKKSMT